MKLAYLICFVALLQISACQEASEVDPATEMDFGNESLSDSTESTANITDPLNTTLVQENTSEVANSDDSITEAVSYSPETDPDTTTVEEEEVSQSQTVSSTTDSNHAASVYPSILALTVPVWFRLVTIKLLGAA